MTGSEFVDGQIRFKELKPISEVTIMEAQTLRQEVLQLRTEKEALRVKSKLFENFAAMAHTCCRTPTAAEWKELKDTLRKTLEFSVELTKADTGSLVLMDSNGVVSDAIYGPSGNRREDRYPAMESRLDKELAGWVRAHRQTGIVTDAGNDDRWELPAGLTEKVQSALAVPVQKGHELLGILSLQHSNPRHFSAEMVEQIQATSDQIAMTIDNARLYGRLEQSYQTLNESKQKVDAYSKALDEELEKGKQIQRDFLPHKLPQIPGCEIATYFAPAKMVSGDFYDFFALPGKNLGIVIGDVSDKGVGAALYMALIRSLIRVFSGHISLHGFSNFSINNGLTRSPESSLATAEQLDALNAVKLTNDYIAHEHGKEGMFATLFLGVVNADTGVLAYINAGHEPLFILNSKGVQRRLKPTGPAVGISPEMQFEMQMVEIKPGDMLFGFTDGVTEAVSPDGDFFTKNRLLSLLEQTDASATDLVDRIKMNVLKHTGNSPISDDITMLAVKRLDIPVK